MKADRELLELAAKAIGYRAVLNKADACQLWTDCQDSAYVQFWNPLTDDGDALRLAVDQMLQVSVYGEEVFAVSLCGKFQIVERTADSPSSATRRAIVRAAAEIGATKEA